MSITRRNLLRAGLAAAAGVLLPFSAAHADLWLPPQPYTPPNPGPTPSLSTWLATHPHITGAMVWQLGDGTLLPYASWTSRQRDALALAFHKAYQGLPSGLPLVPPELPVSRIYGTGTIAAADAWSYFLAYLGHILALELRGDLAWSIGALEDAQQLEILFDSREYFERGSTSAAYLPKYPATLAPPEYVYGFLRTNEMIGSGAPSPAAARLAAYARLVSWCGDKMSHFLGSLQDRNNLWAHWQYHGPPPVARVIGGTSHTSAPSVLSHFTGGCQGTSAFLRSVTRAMNMAVEFRSVGQHTTARMMANDLYLSHGDDPYTRTLTMSTAPVPASLTCPADALFFNGVTYFDWFVTQFSASDPNKNVGRRAKEVAVAYLPLGLLDMHLYDLQHGYTHAGSTVAAALAGRYSVADLEAMQLWQQMDAKIAAHGGPTAISGYAAQVEAEKHL